MSALRSPVTAAPDQLKHWLFLLLCGGVLAGAWILEVRGRDVYLPVIELPLPATCTYRRWVGVDCPGCGLTRCFIRMAHGDLPGAWGFNPAGTLLFALAVIQIPYRAMQIWRVRRGLAEWRLPAVSYWLLVSLVAAMLLQWLWRTYAGYWF